MLGQTLKHYRIIGRLGAGGMGEVFAAEDMRLHRRVAIKMLPAEAGSDPARRERLEREARAVAALSHPNIVTLYSVEESDGLTFLTMEYLDGRTLADVVQAERLAIGRLLRIAAEIAQALAAAHQQGITHRDLKPANVMLTVDGRVKVLDFGIAKFHERAEDQDNASTLAAVTGGSQVIGTVAYMSPEQVERRAVDHRSDIFSFGVMLYEVATGVCPFRGTSTAAIISAILRDDPAPATDLRPDVPAKLNDILGRCLKKEPSQRYANVADLCGDLEQLLASLHSPTAPQTSAKWAWRPHLSRRAALGFAAFALAAAIGGMLLGGLRQSETFEVERMSRLTSDGDVTTAVLSPDGAYVAHVKDGANGPSLWVRQTTTASEVQIVPPADREYLGVSYSPDGSYVYFVTSSDVLGSLYRVPALGGTASRLVEDVDSGVGVSPDGNQLAFVRTDIDAGVTHVIAVASDGSAPRILATSGPDIIFDGVTPSWSPDGSHLLVAAVQSTAGRQRYAGTIDAGTGVLTLLPDAWTSIRAVDWFPDGRSFVLSASDAMSTSSQIWQVSLDSAKRTRITNDVDDYSSVDAARDGNALAAVRSRTVATLWSVDTVTGQGREILSGRRDDGAKGIAWASTGDIVFSSTRSGTNDLWSVRLDGDSPRQLTSGVSVERPRISNDARWIVFSGGYQVWKAGFDGSRATPLTRGGREHTPVIADNGWVYYLSLEPLPRPYRVPLAGGNPERLSDEYFIVTDVIPTGDLLGYMFDQPEMTGFAATMSPNGGPIRRYANVPVQWSSFQTLRSVPGGMAVTFVHRDKGRAEVWQQPLNGGTAVQLTRGDNGDVFSYAWAGDGKHIALSRGTIERDALLIHRK